MLDDVGAFLVANAIGVLGVDIWKSGIPTDAADDSVGMVETSGPPPELVHESATPFYEHATFQLMVRGLKYKDARTRINTVWKLLTTVRNVTLGTTRYLSITALQTPFDFGDDENHRARLIANFDAFKEVV